MNFSCIYVFNTAAGLDCKPHTIPKMRVLTTLRKNLFMIRSFQNYPKFPKVQIIMKSDELPTSSLIR